MIYDYIIRGVPPQKKETVSLSAANSAKDNIVEVISKLACLIVRLGPSTRGGCLRGELNYFSFTSCNHMMMTSHSLRTAGRIGTCKKYYVIIKKGVESVYVSFPNITHAV